MSQKKWVVRTSDYSLPQVWTENGEECVTDRVFNGHGPMIAAAPELLAALKKLVIEIGTLCSSYCITETELLDEVPEFVEAVNRADELLLSLKAKGVT